MSQGFTEVHLIDVITKEQITWPANCLISYHIEVPMSASYHPGIFVCAKGTCYPVLSTLSAAKKLIEEEIN
jgi:hypothetical protein